MRRTQLYLDDDLWQALHLHSRQSGLSISELVRRAARDCYLGAAVRRQDAMRALVGLWKDRPDIKDSEAYVRKLRKGSRLARLAR